jgi:hypothetical protein
MKKTILAAAVALLLSSILVGQSQAQQVLIVSIPFAFAAGDKTLPAGEYQIQAVLSDSETTQSLRQSDGSASTMVLTLKADPKGKEIEPKLIFNCYGHEYFLSQIWLGESRGRQLPKSRREKELALNETPNQIALLLVGRPAQR